MARDQVGGAFDQLDHPVTPLRMPAIPAWASTTLLPPFTRSISRKRCNNSLKAAPGQIREPLSVGS